MASTDAFFAMLQAIFIALSAILAQLRAQRHLSTTLWVAACVFAVAAMLGALWGL